MLFNGTQRRWDNVIGGNQRQAFQYLFFQAMWTGAFLVPFKLKYYYDFMILRFLENRQRFIYFNQSNRAYFLRLFTGI